MNRPQTSRALGLCAALLLCAACGGGVPILMYHSVSSDGSPLTITPATLDQQLDYLAHAGFTTVSIGEVIDDQEGRGRLPPHPVVLTFDDGYQEVMKTVLPLLEKRGQHATFFIVSGFTAHDESHRHQEGAKSHLIVEELKTLRAAGMEIGSHTVNHVKLTSLPKESLRLELSKSKLDLEHALGAPVSVFSYPYTAQRKDIRAEVQQAGYRAAVTGPHGSSDPYNLQRITIHRGLTVDDLRGLLAESWGTGYSSGGN